ncbi:MAG: FtsH protease activity modulator HflK [Gammaproteobacteria bacterium]|nr:FtsH protease activity modulator HflK [Gammaproteobacteria bacterium]
MAWNEPGGGRDPWGGNNQQGPPDLEQAIKNLQGKLSGIFGGRGGGQGGGSRGGGGPNFSKLGVMVIIGVLFVGWLVAGFYIVDPAEEAVVTRFGNYVRTETSGPHWLPYFIEKHETVNVAQVRSAEVGFRTAGRTQGSVGNESLMLTQDENIVDIKFAVQYRVKDARDYLFNVRDPDLTLRQVTESAVREVVGKSTMDFVLTGGRSAVADDTRVLVQDTLDKYGAGLFVISVNMQDAQPPAQVQDAFNDAVKAREDEERLKNEAQAFANEILPKARGEGDAIRERAQGYKQRVTAQAEGQSDRFLALLTEYQKAPDVTRERIYLETMESVLGKSSKVLLGAEGSNNLMYLPLDKLMSRGFEDDEDGAGQDGDSGTSTLPASRLRNDSDRFRSGRTR